MQDPLAASAPLRTHSQVASAEGRLAAGPPPSLVSQPKWSRKTRPELSSRCEPRSPREPLLLLVPLSPTSGSWEALSPAPTVLGAAESPVSTHSQPVSPHNKDSKGSIEAAGGSSASGLLAGLLGQTWSLCPASQSSPPSQSPKGIPSPAVSPRLAPWAPGRGIVSPE